MNDLTMTATPEAYTGTLERLLQSPDCDAVLAAVGSSAQFHPEFAVQPILQARRNDKPLAAFLTPHAERSLALLAEKGIPAFRTPEACADALGSFFAWRAPRPEFGDGARTNSGSVPELMVSLGIPMAQQQIVEAPRYEHTVPYPVALKRLDVEHKTEAGGVVLDIGAVPELLAAANRMRQPRLLVQKMEKGLAEAIVGYRDDPVVGPLVLVGAGGTLAELYKDFAVAMAPVTEEEAIALIEQVKGLAVIRGYRNLPRGDLRALARAVSALSRLAFTKEVREAEINPLIVRREGVIAVDVRLVQKE
jgi:acetate---CoA ligase (ADP-forming)